MLEERGQVIADFERRKAYIRAEVMKAAADLGGKADVEEALLEEVTSLVEWPVVLTASFEQRFLEVPAEALVYTMKGDQKYFPVYDQTGKLMPNFVITSYSIHYTKLYEEYARPELGLSDLRLFPGETRLPGFWRGAPPATGRPGLSP